jgi:hypothetical protein
VKALFDDASSSPYSDALVDIVIGMDASHQIPIWVLGKALVGAHSLTTLGRIFSHIIAREDVDDDEIVKMLDGYGSIEWRDEAVEAMLKSLLSVRNDLSARLLLEIILRTGRKVTCMDAFALLLVQPSADDEIMKALKVAQKEGWKVYNDLVDATCGAGKTYQCKNFEKVTEDEGSDEGCGCVTANVTSTKIAVYNSSITFSIKGVCNGDEAVAALVEKETQSICAAGQQWVEEYLDKGDLKCTDGNFYVELSGYCK